ncbi:hypothetical protein V6R21_13335 [Limibacter armeniacum]|uniref:hypothetical protein n=1 Tax=Limibacter armeniacum TaxID=466084 RepID=UPI002FE5C491
MEVILKDLAEDLSTLLERLHTAEATLIDVKLQEDGDKVGEQIPLIEQISVMKKHLNDLELRKNELLASVQEGSFTGGFEGETTEQMLQRMKQKLDAAKQEDQTREVAEKLRLDLNMAIGGMKEIEASVRNIKSSMALQALKEKMKKNQ